MSDNFSDRFGGQTLKPADVSFKAFVLTENLFLDWAHLSTNDNFVAKIMEVMPDAAGRTMTLPDAQEVSVGETFIIRNIGAHPVNVLLYDGSGIYTVNPGQGVYFYLKTNEDQNGLWDALLLGVGTGALDLQAAAGAGLVVINGKLVTSEQIIGLTDDTTLNPDQARARFYVWVGGTGTVTLPRATDAGVFRTEFRNQGAGALTFQCQPGETIDGSSSIVLQVGESCALHAGNYSNNWFTVGRGRATQFAFSQLRKEVTGGVVGLTLTEAANVVQTYVGTLASNAEVVLPAVVQVYYVSNQTSGTYNLRIRNPEDGGRTVSIPVGQNAVLFSDGKNVINASTTVAGIANLLMDSGSETNPSLAIGASNSGVYTPGSGHIGIVVNGKIRGQFTPDGLSVWGRQIVIDSSREGGDSNLVVKGPAGTTRYLQLSSDTVRWTMLADALAETGGNKGSNWQLARYGDKGEYLGPCIVADRSTGGVSIRDLGVTDLYVGEGSIRDRAEVGSLRVFVGDAIPRKNYILLDGRLLSRTAYPELFRYMVEQGGFASENDWGVQGYFGRFSVGDNVSNFRVPDIRAMFIRNLNAGRADEGIDPRREWGRYQDQQVASHGHNVVDYGHGHSAITVFEGEHNHYVNDPAHEHPYGVQQGGGVAYANVGGNPSPAFSATGGALTGVYLSPAGNHRHGVQVDGAYTGITIGLTGGSDQHPRNIAYPVYIRYV